jgi:hypothetical protein
VTRPLAVGGVLALAVLCWTVGLHVGPLGDTVITDVPLYRDVAERIASGEVPYRDFALEYPPLAAGLFWLAGVPAIAYTASFSALMLLCLGVVAIAGMAIAQRLDLGDRRTLAVGIAVAVSPLLVGALIETRYDLALAALVAASLWALVAGRPHLGWALLGLGVLVKLVPLILVPVLVVHSLHRYGGRVTARAAALAVAVVAIGVVPFALIAPGGTWESVSYHRDRPLQIESTGSAYLLALHALADIDLTVETTFGSQNLVGEGPRAIAAATSGVLVLLVVAITVVTAMAMREARRPGLDRILVAGVASTLVATLVCGKVLSPQFTLWLLPAGLLIAGRYGRAAFVATLATLALTHAYFPRLYWDLVALDTWPIALLVARDAALIVLLALAWPRPSIAHPARHRARSRGTPSPVSARHLLD